MHFDVFGKPQGKGRPKFTSQGGYARAYTPKATSDYEKLIRAAFYQARNEMNYDKNKPILIAITAHFTPPQSMSKKKQEALISNIKPYDKKPDLDNIVKIVLDALNGTAYDDDKQIVGLAAEKRYSSVDKVSISICNVTEV